VYIKTVNDQDRVTGMPKALAHGTPKNQNAHLTKHVQYNKKPTHASIVEKILAVRLVNGHKMNSSDRRKDRQTDRPGPP